MPEYRKLARIVQEETDLITFGSVDCDAHRNLCQANSVNQYPTIRVYTNNAQYDYPSNWWRNVESMKQWVTGYLPTNVHSLDEYELIDLIEGDYTKAVILDFYASWCQPCQVDLIKNINKFYSHFRFLHPYSIRHHV
jgi:thioredoxin-like negative regulator of GroEL